MAIPIVQSTAVVTRGLVSQFSDVRTPNNFLRSFFRPVERMTKNVYIQVERNGEPIALSRARYTNGQLNEFSIMTEKEIEPPYFHEKFVMNNHRLYDVMLATGDEGSIADWNAWAMRKMEQIRYKIDRAIELMCANVLEDGIVQLANGDNIDFKRKSASKVAYSAATQWADDTVNPFTTLKNGCEFVRNTGKYGGSTFNAILGDTAIQDLLNNAIFIERQDLTSMKLDAVMPPERNVVGGVYHGTVTAGAYRVNLWSYPDTYDNASGVATKYVNEKICVIIPTETKFDLAFGAVPQLIGDNGRIPQQGAFLMYDTKDEDLAAHTMHIKCAPIPIPTAIDQIYTVQVVS